jgi:hypothetical protein
MQLDFADGNSLQSPMHDVLQRQGAAIRLQTLPSVVL